MRYYVNVYGINMWLAFTSKQDADDFCSTKPLYRVNVKLK